MSGRSRSLYPSCRRGAIVAMLTAALVLAGCNTTGHALSARPRTVALTTTFLLPSSLCPPDQGDYVDQRANGDYTACLRVPAVAGASVVVALQADLTGVSSNATPTTSIPTSIPTDPLSLALSTRTTTPGATVGVVGHFARPPTTEQRRASTNATLCWDGCDGLQEQAVAIHWTSSTTFHATLSVPDAAWLVDRQGRVTVHPLQSGRYPVAVQCVIATPGCELTVPHASAAIALRAPRPTRCVTGRHCATMTLSATVAQVGDRLLVRGWAPLQTIIGQPFGYVLVTATGSRARHFPSLTISRHSKDHRYVVENVVLAPTRLPVRRGATWAALTRVRVVSWIFSGLSAVSTSPNSPAIAWCEPSGVVITAGGSAPLHVVPTTNVAAALRGSGLRGPEPSGASTPCATVQLDPHHLASVYAGFASEHGASIPPQYVAPLYTTNAGTTWHTVPIPPGASIETFGGFALRGASVAALFYGPGGVNRRDPAGTNHGIVRTEVTSNGGITWTASTLGCPASGPCVTFGPYPSGDCNMTNANQSLLVGPPGTNPAHGVHWTVSSWESSVDSCFPQQLASSRHRLFLVDPSSQYPLQESATDGRTWNDVALPLLAAAKYGPDSVPTSNSLVLAPDATLFAIITSPSQQRQSLFRLAPGASSWCRVPGVLDSSIAAEGVAGPLRVNEADLAWSQTTYPSGAALVITRHVLALSHAHCSH